LIEATRHEVDRDFRTRLTNSSNADRLASLRPRIDEELEEPEVTENPKLRAPSPPRRGTGDETRPLRTMAEVIVNSVVQRSREGESLEALATWFGLPTDVVARMLELADGLY